MKYSLTLALACSAVFFACSDSEKVAGTATDTENMMTASVTGAVVRSDGTPADSVVVRMSRVYSKKEALGIPEFVEVRTDTAGVFAFDSAVADTFQLAVIDEGAEEISYLPRVAASSTGDLDSIKLEKAAVFSSLPRVHLWPNRSHGLFANPSGKIFPIGCRSKFLPKAQVLAQQCFPAIPMLFPLRAPLPLNLLCPVCRLWLQA